MAALSQTSWRGARVPLAAGALLAISAAAWLLTTREAPFGATGAGDGALPGGESPVAAAGAPVQAPSGILLITIDTLRADVASVYGGPAATPGLEALAAAGTRFDRAVAHAVLTLPSHTSIMTGLDPSRHGVQENSGFRAADELDTLAERLHDAGYATGAFVAAFPLDSQFGLAQGFDLYDDHYDTGAFSEFQMVERPSRDVVPPARRWIRQQSGPWFAWVHVYDPHAPYEPPEPQASEYPDDPYAGEVASVDAALAPLLEDALRAGALVVVTSDHGEGRGDHGELRHGIFAYESTLHVPLIVAWPGVLPGGQSISERVRLVDLMPTVCEAAGVDCPGMDGASLLPALRGATRVAAESSYFESMSPYLTRGWAPLRGIYDGDWKYIDVPIPDLYRMSADPAEANNLAERESARLASMKRLLQEHLEGAETMQAAVAAESAETLERLGALGYLGATSTHRERTDFGPEDDPKNLIDLDTMMQEAIQLGAGGDVDRAVGLFLRILDRRPDFIRVHALLAGLRARQGDLDGAIEQLDRALRAGIQAPYLLTRLGMYLRDAGRLDEAADVLAESLRGEPDNLLTINLLATVEGARGRADDALRLIDLGLELDPSYGLLYANRGTVYLSQGRLEDAREQFETALEHDVRLAEAHNGLGVIAAQSNDLEEALQRWRTAVSVNPELWDAQFNLGMTLVRLERLGEAQPVLELFASRAPASRYAQDIARVRDLLARMRGRR